MLSRGCHWCESGSSLLDETMRLFLRSFSQRVIIKFPSICIYALVYRVVAQIPLTQIIAVLLLQINCFTKANCYPKLLKTYTKLKLSFCLDLENPINLAWIYSLLVLSVVLQCSRCFLTITVMWAVKQAWCWWRYKEPFKEPLPTARILITLMVSSVVPTLFYYMQIDGIPLNVV